MTHQLLYADLKTLHVTLDGFVISGEIAAQVYGVVEDLISASVAQHAYYEALADRAGIEPPSPGADTTRFDYAIRTPPVFAQAWVRTLRDIASALIVLANEPSTAEAARSAAAAFGKAFPGVATAEGPMRVHALGDDQVYYAVGPGRFPVRIDDAALRDLEASVRTLIDALPKETPFRAG